MGLKLVKYGTILTLIFLVIALLYQRQGIRNLAKVEGRPIKSFELYIDKNAQLSYKDFEHHQQSFSLDSTLDLNPTKDIINAYWLRITTDSNQFVKGTASYLYLGVHDEVDLFTSQGDSIKGGLFYKGQGPHNARFYFPLHELKGADEYLLRVKDHFWIKDKIEPRIYSKAEMENNEAFVYQRGDHQYILFSVALLSVLAYAILFFLMQYFQVKEQAFLFYSIYLICVLFYFLRGFEYRTEYFVVFSHFPGSVIYFEPVILFLTHAFYAPFIYYFLNIPNESAHLKKIFDTFFYVIIGAFVLSTTLMVIMNF